jgi:hypothetical protein
MIESLIIGGLTNLVSKYVNFREEKARNQMEIEKEIKSRHLQLDIIRESNESNLITIKEKQIMISEVLAKSKIEFAKTARSDQAKLDKILYTRMDKTILNVTALMKPIITYAFLSIILCVVFYGIFGNNPEQYEQTIYILEDLGVLSLAEMAIGFWFGAIGVDSISRKR